MRTRNRDRQGVGTFDAPTARAGSLTVAVPTGLPAAPPDAAPVTRGARLRRVARRLAAPPVWCAAALGAALAACGWDGDDRRPPTALQLTLGGTDLGETKFAPHGVWHPRSLGIAAVSDGLRCCGSGNWHRPLFGLAAAWDGAAAGPGIFVIYLGTGPAVLFLLCCAVPWWVLQSWRGWARDPDGGRFAVAGRFAWPWAVTFAALAVLCVGTAGGVRVPGLGSGHAEGRTVQVGVRASGGRFPPRIELRADGPPIAWSPDAERGDRAVEGWGVRLLRSHRWPGSAFEWNFDGLGGTQYGFAERRLAVSLWWFAAACGLANGVTLWRRRRARAKVAA